MFSLNFEFNIHQGFPLFLSALRCRGEKHYLYPLWLHKHTLSKSLPAFKPYHYCSQNTYMSFNPTLHIL